MTDKDKKDLCEILIFSLKVSKMNTLFTSHQIRKFSKVMAERFINMPEEEDYDREPEKEEWWKE
jgi:hypothetical protein